MELRFQNVYNIEYDNRTYKQLLIIIQHIIKHTLIYIVIINDII